ncbi:PEP-CTERM sorting domain-containing protein [Bythopirellula polymerisocia]|uniref:Ice-binding protein C-terminal domain-containing protein n=1 Tax=Bythopirellula polymerisocia TaxID=2528003 RepID=A0A5C6CYJ3_9BACT|nr:PEP-CTERM sorting domain-containing protein [Bythopirellula polymerisocia]TWU29640.1 hypothetical protein Pla144_04190 [Bythopirellula polymerisocia]
MRNTILATAIVLITSSPTLATLYRGSFDTFWKLGAFEDYPAVAMIEATSDGVNFKIDSMTVQFTAMIPARPAFGSGSLNPIAVSINMFTDSQPLSFIPASDVATINPLQFGWDVQYAGIYREGISFEAVGVNSQAPVGTRSTNTLFDFGLPGEIEVIFDSFVDWSLPLLETPIGITFTGLSKPTEPVKLAAIPEPASAVLALLGISLFGCWRRLGLTM